MHAIASTDALPYVAGLFTCDDCGSTQLRQGREAIEPPVGWDSKTHDGRVAHRCVDCAPPAPAASAGR